MTDWAQRLAQLPDAHRAWIVAHGSDWRLLLRPPVLVPEPDTWDHVDVEIEAPDGTRFDPALLRATHVGQRSTALPVGDRMAPVAGTVIAVEVAAGRRTATLTIRIDDLPAWRAAGLPPEVPC